MKICTQCNKEFSPVIGIMKKCLECRYNSKKLEVSDEIIFSAKRRLRSIKRNAYVREIPFKLSLEHLKYLLIQPCYYCNAIEYSFSVDRKLNNLGYTDKNTVAACINCNTLKNTKTLEEFASILYN